MSKVTAAVIEPEIWPVTEILPVKPLLRVKFLL
jgi:hypothetical protein